MQVSEIKQQLHHAINNIGDESYLQALLTILLAKSESINDFVLSKEQIRILEEREEKYISGQSKAISLDDLKLEMNQRYGL